MGQHRRTHRPLRRSPQDLHLPLLHQGSLHFGGPLPVPRNRLADALLDGFRDTLHVTFTPFTPDHTLLQRIAELEHDKYDNPDWNARR